MKITAAVLFGLLLVLGLTQPVAAKAAGELLEQYLNDPAVASQEELALVEVTAVNDDPKPEDNWKRTGTLELRKIESTGPKLPETFSVRFYDRGDSGADQWTWDGVELRKGGRLLGFFNQWNRRWAVRGDGRTHVISNVERLDEKVLARAQKLFKTPLVVKPATTQASPATAPVRTPPPYTDEQAMGFEAKLPDLQYPTTIEAACKVLGIDANRLGDNGVMLASTDGMAGQTMARLSPTYWITFQFDLAPRDTGIKRVLIYKVIGK